MTRETGVSLVAGLMCGISCYAGFVCGTETADRQWQSECVNRGVAEHDKASGDWRWIGTTVEKSK